MELCEQSNYYLLSGVLLSFVMAQFDETPPPIKVPVPVILKNESIEFVKECCLLGLKISTDILNRNIDATIQTFFIENVTNFELTFLCYLATLNQN